MTTKENIIRKIIAVVVCVIVFFGWGCLCASLDLKRGGGVLGIAIICGILSAIWAAITKKKKNTDEIDTNEENEENTTNEK